MATFDDLQKNVTEIAARLNADPALAKAALVNPVLALQELGYEPDLEARLELEDRARFCKKDIAARTRLRARLFKEAGRVFDPGNPDHLSAVLYDELKIDEATGERPDTGPLTPLPRPLAVVAERPKLTRLTAAQSVKQRTSRGAKAARAKAPRMPEPGLIAIETIDDPLAVLEGTHAIVKPLLEYRQIDATTAPFAPASVYRAVREGKRRLANVTLRAVVTGAG